MIRQALGVSVARITNHYDEHRGLEQKIAVDLATVLGPLLPSATDIAAFSAQVVKKAVALKYELAAANVVYTCFWVNNGAPYDEGSIHPTGGIQEKVCMCTFPGMTKLVEPGPDSVVVVKAHAFMNSK